MTMISTRASDAYLASRISFQDEISQELVERRICSHVGESLEAFDLKKDRDCYTIRLNTDSL